MIISLELTGYITGEVCDCKEKSKEVSKLFRAYRFYNYFNQPFADNSEMFQSSFELTGYITEYRENLPGLFLIVSKLFRAYRLYNKASSFVNPSRLSFKALSSLQVI